jgi:hypothetical protein
MLMSLIHHGKKSHNIATQNDHSEVIRPTPPPRPAIRPPGSTPINSRWQRKAPPDEINSGAEVALLVPHGERGDNHSKPHYPAVHKPENKAAATPRKVQPL